jgi:hypothetical protein
VLDFNLKKNQFLYFVCAVLLVLGFFSHCRQSIRVFLPGSSPVLALLQILVPLKDFCFPFYSHCRSHRLFSQLPVFVVVPDLYPRFLLRAGDRTVDLFLMLRGDRVLAPLGR